MNSFTVQLIIIFSLLPGVDQITRCLFDKIIMGNAMYINDCKHRRVHNKYSNNNNNNMVQPNDHPISFLWLKHISSVGT